MTDHVPDAGKIDHIIKAAQEAGFANQYPTAPMLAMFERFYTIAYRQGMERAAEICDARYVRTQETARMGTSVECADVIRAHAQTIDMTAPSCTKSEEI